MTDWQLGLDAFQGGRLREAADRLRVAANNHERAISQAVSFQTYAYLGAALYALGEAGLAADAFAKAITLRLTEATPIDLTINLANAYIASGNRQQAEQALEEALRDKPGAMEVNTLLQRLRSHGEPLPLTGTILGETPESVKRYIDTLSFGQVSQGYSPEQVRSALSQITHYIDVLSTHLMDSGQTIAQYKEEIERLRQTEETLIVNLMQSRQALDQARGSGEAGPTNPDAEHRAAEATGEDADSANLTPLEKLFQRKS